MSALTDLADAIERGRREHPELRQARGALFRAGRHEVWQFKPGVTAACALGFANLGGRRPWWVPVRCPAGTHFECSVSRLNDDHRWSIERIVAYLRTPEAQP